MRSNNLARLGLAPLSILSLLLGGVITTSFAQDNDNLNGRELYVSFGCHYCHGFEGQGSQASPPNPRIAPTPYPLEAFAAFLRTPIRLMPPYSQSVMSDEQLRSIYDYVVSIPEPPAAEEIPALRDL